MPTTCDPAFQALVEGYERGPSKCLLAGLIQRHKNLPRTQRRPYYKQVLLRYDDSCIVRIVWAPEGRTRPHKHGGSSVKIYVAQGTLEQDLFVLWGEGCKLQERFIHLEGERFCEDPETVHRIGNASPLDWAISLHLFVPPLETMEVFDFTYNEHWIVQGDEDTLGEPPSDAIPIWPKFLLIPEPGGGQGITHGHGL